MMEVAIRTLDDFNIVLNGLKKLIDIDAEFKPIASDILIDQIADLNRRVPVERKNADGNDFTPYASRRWKKEREKRGINPVSPKNYTFTGSMWKSVKVISNKFTGRDTVTAIAGATGSPRDKMLWGTEYEVKHGNPIIMAANNKEVDGMKRAAYNRIHAYIKKTLQAE